MFRLVGASRVLREAVPTGLVDLFAIVTVLGGGPFILVVLALAYWNLERRRETLTLVSVAFVALAVTVVLKGWFDLPRPPAGIRQHPVESGSAGFPSGHAIAATVVYGGALLGSERTRHLPSMLVVVGLVVGVSVSRVVLGVHYLGDVIAGVFLGLVVLTAWVAIDRDPVVTFGLAAGVSALALALTGDPDGAIGLGGSLGGLVAIRWNPELTSLHSQPERVAVNLSGVVVVGLAGVAGSFLGESTPVIVAVSFCIACAFVAVPLTAKPVGRSGLDG